RIAARLFAAASYDVFPELSARVRRFVYSPLGILVLAALTALLCGFFLHPQGFVLCGGVVAVILLGILWPWLNLRGLQATMSFKRTRASEGDGVDVSVELRSHLPWSAWGLAVRGGFRSRAA